MAERTEPGGSPQKFQNGTVTGGAGAGLDGRGGVGVMHADALVFALLAAGDFALIVYLRRRHGRRAQNHRMSESLRYAVRRATDPTQGF